MGEVYLAEHKYIARKAAIKFLLRDLSNSSELVGRFFAEARAASVIKHPGIVEVLDCDVHDGRAYIVMELLARGEPARLHRTRRQRRPRRARARWGSSGRSRRRWPPRTRRRSSTATSSPTTSSCTSPRTARPPTPIAKVLDFGIAKLMGRGEGGTKTRTGQLLGTPMYMSPEQCRGVKQIDNRSDIYSLGCIMYEVFCGNAPFLDEGFGDLIIAHVSRPPPEPLHAAPWMSAPARRLLLDCLAKDPADRPQSMRDVVARLSQLYPSEEIALQVPVSVERRPRAGARAGRANLGLAVRPAPGADHADAGVGGDLVERLDADGAAGRVGDAGAVAERRVRAAAADVPAGGNHHAQRGGTHARLAARGYGPGATGTRGSEHAERRRCRALQDGAADAPGR